MVTLLPGREAHVNQNAASSIALRRMYACSLLEEMSFSGFRKPNDWPTHHSNGKATAFLVGSTKTRAHTSQMDLVRPPLFLKCRTIY